MAAMTLVQSVALPIDSAITPLFVGADLADAYATELPDAAGEDVISLARSILASPPAWASKLMVLRDWVMPVFGVKAATNIREAAEDRGLGVIGSFPILEHRKREVIMGEKDRHLDFSTSILLRNTVDGREIVWITAVHCHNRLGRAYLTFISPFHRAIIKALLARASRRGWRQ